MFSVFRFDLPSAVTKQLLTELHALKTSPLRQENLRLLSEFQGRHEIKQGVYLLLVKEVPTYVGKADDVCERLEEHLWKLRGRQNIAIEDVGFKALLLEVAWSTAANENLLIAAFQAKNQCVWNKKGFGPKDPGKHRDGHEPGWFDQTFPIRDDWPCTGIDDEMRVGDLLWKLKDQLPFLLRFEIDDAVGERKVKLKGVPRNARALLLKAAEVLGPGWQLMLFKSHLTLYNQRKSYSFGEELYPKALAK